MDYSSNSRTVHILEKISTVSEIMAFTVESPNADTLLFSSMLWELVSGSIPLRSGC